MRFRKRVKIIKGLHLNLSNSGLSLSAGVRGASVTFGKRGTYLNTGIPGTGLYNRTKIDGSSSSGQPSNSNRALQIPSGEATVSINLDDRGNPTLTLTDEQGRQITNESILRRVKQSDRFKQSVAQLIESRKKKIDEETEKFINIAAYTPEIIQEEILRKEFDQLEPQYVPVNEFNIQQPQKESVKQELETEAKKKINKLFFWNNKKLRENYVNENLDIRFNNKMDEWEKAKQQFIIKETSYKKEKDKEYFDEYTATKTELEKILSGDTEYIEERIENIISEITLPIEFTLDYEYHSEINQLKIDLDLPEIENMPQEKANILSTGKISIKKKSQKEIKKEYSQCVCGIAFFLSGTFLNISPKINEVIISGYTQRINKATGNLENQYIYSVKFLRDKFSSINFKNIEPLEALIIFENNMSVLSDFEFKTITPL